MSAPGGCLLPGGVCSRGCLLLGVSAPGGSALGVCFQGVSAPGGGGLLQGGVCSRGDGIPACTEADTPPMNRMTDRCKNITLPQTSFAGGNKKYQRKNLPLRSFLLIVNEP